MTESILITGGSGFLAQHLVRELQTKKFDKIKEIRLFDLEPYEPIFEYPRNVPMVQIQGDCAEREDMEYALRGVTAVFHLCSEKYTFDMYDSSEKQWRNNFESTKTLIDVMVEKSVPFLVNVGHAMSHVSWSESVLNPAEIRTLTAPSSYLLGHYGESKFKAEQLVIEANGKLLKSGEKLVSISIRPPFLYGEGDSWLVPYSLELANQIGGTIPQLSDRDEKMQMTYAGNCAAMLVQGLTCLRENSHLVGGEVFFCNDGNNTSLYNYFDYITPFMNAAGFHVTDREIFSYQFSVLSTMALEKVLRLFHRLTGQKLGPLPNSRVVSFVSNLQFTFSTTKAFSLMGWRAPYDHKTAMSKTQQWWAKKIKKISQLDTLDNEDYPSKIEPARGLKKNFDIDGNCLVN